MNSIEREIKQQNNIMTSDKEMTLPWHSMGPLPLLCHQKAPPISPQGNLGGHRVTTSH